MVTFLVAGNDNEMRLATRPGSGKKVVPPPLLDCSDVVTVWWSSEDGAESLARTIGLFLLRLWRVGFVLLSPRATGGREMGSKA